MPLSVQLKALSFDAASALLRPASDHVVQRKTSSSKPKDGEPEGIGPLSLVARLRELGHGALQDMFDRTPDSDVLTLQAILEGRFHASSVPAATASW